MQNDFMQEAINEFIKETGIVVFFQNRTIFGPVKVHLRSWCNGDGQYCSLAIPCTDADVISCFGVDVTGCKTLKEKINKYYLPFDSKEDWDKGKWDLEKIDGYINKFRKIANIGIVGKIAKFDNYEFLGSNFWASPEIGATIWYRGPEGINNFTIFIGRQTEVVVKHDSFLKMVEALGVLSFITPVIENETMMIQAFDDVIDI